MYVHKLMPGKYICMGGEEGGEDAQGIGKIAHHPLSLLYLWTPKLKTFRSFSGIIKRKETFI